MGFPECFLLPIKVSNSYKDTTIVDKLISTMYRDRKNVHIYCLLTIQVAKWR